MAAKTTKDSMAWLKLNVGLFTTETGGLSDRHIVLYIKLMLLYWASGNTLPSTPSILQRRMGVSSHEDEVILAELLSEFFPLDIDGNYTHVELDRQLDEIKAFSQKQADRRRGKFKQSNMEEDEGNF